ncbi:hypothetical protein L1049_004484 [Liquidambar formosana]|uniref:Uncharacterized protein n=1 Tax=Liquidambar formosana TaxID=63359 RepID=A0AAP0RTX5_LIQFO
MISSSDKNVKTKHPYKNFWHLSCEMKRTNTWPRYFSHGSLSEFKECSPADSYRIAAAKYHGCSENYAVVKSNAWKEDAFIHPSSKTFATVYGGIWEILLVKW